MTSLRLKTLSIAALMMLPACATVAQDPVTTRPPVPFTAEELDNLVAPVALYPDPLLAQLLIAATFQDQVVLAARHVRERGDRDIDNQPWDVSVRAVAHYPPVLNMLYEDEDWSTALGQAYATQSGDLMDAVQRLREMARQHGNLVSTDEQTVHVERERIVIVPANPRVIYVPTYDPGVIFFRPVIQLGVRTGFWSFGFGFPIGDWLVYDVDWYGRRIYYDGWYGGGWRHYARPYIVLRPVYVHPRYRVIHVGSVSGRIVNYFNLQRHRRIHQRVSWERYDRDWRPNDRARGPRDNNDRNGWDGRDRGPRNGPGDRDNRPGNRDRDNDRGPRNDPRGNDDNRRPGNPMGLGALPPADRAPRGSERDANDNGARGRNDDRGTPRGNDDSRATPRGSARPDARVVPSIRGSVKPQAVEPSRPPVIRGSVKPQSAEPSRSPIIRGGTVVTPRSKAEPRAQSRGSGDVRVAPSRPSVQAKSAPAARPTVRAQAPSKSVKSSGSSGSQGKGSSARSGSGSGKGKGGGG